MKHSSLLRRFSLFAALFCGGAVLIVFIASRTVAATIDVAISASGFGPQFVQVMPGDTVRWVNNDIKDHWVASNDHPTHLLYPETGWDSGAIPPGGSFSFTLNAVGEWGYHDHLYPSYIGGVRVSTTQQLMPPPSFELPPYSEGGATISGRVTLSDGTPAGGAFVDVFSDTTGFRHGSQADNAGNYAVNGIPAGTYIAIAYPPIDARDLGSSEKVTIALGENETQTRDFVLKSFELNGPKTILVTVQREGGTRVTDARAFAHNPTTGQNTMTTRHTDGVYTLKIFGGSWWVNVEPQDPARSDWFSGRGYEIQFAQNESQETQNVTFTVLGGGGTVTGTIRPPAGSTLPEFMGVGLRNQDGLEFQGPVQPDGSFSVRVLQGSYRLFAHSPDQRFAGPEIPAFSVVEGETKNLGVLTLVERKERIRGVVRASDGTPAANARVHAFAGGTEAFAFTQTQSDGRYELYVTPSLWGVQADPSEGAMFIGSGEPRFIEVNAGATVEGIDFVFRNADATLTGSVVDANANFITDLFGWAFLMPQEGFGEHIVIGGEIRNGRFSFGVLRGNWKVSAHFGPSSPYGPGPAIPVTIEPGQGLDVRVVALRNDAVISGTVRKPDGTALTGVDAHAFAVNTSTGAWQDAFVEKTTGRYRLNVAAGSWALGLRVDPKSGYTPLQPQKSLVIAVASGQTVTQNLTVLAADAAITGFVRSSDGTPLSNVWVSADKLGFESMDPGELPPLEGEPMVSPHEQYGAQTDNSGAYRIALPSGTYFLHAFLPPSRGLISPPEQKVVLTSAQTATANLVFRIADAQIQGQVLLGVVGTRAFVWTWSEKGGHSEASADENGNFTLAVASNDRWHVGAVAKRGNEVFRSAETVVDVSLETATITMELLATNLRLPDTQAVSVPVNQPSMITLEDGTTFSAPANAFGQEGTVTVNVAPDVEVASQGFKNVVGVAYEIEVRDTGGRPISELNLEAALLLPIPEELQETFGVEPEDLRAMFFDETTGAWKQLEKSVVDAEGGFVSAATSHLTRFAIVAPADTTPPSAPSNLSVAALSGSVALSWVNPGPDFQHVRIYRSTAAGEVGGLVSANIQDTTYLDSGLANGVTYYYTVRAVDLAGNESTNTNQVTVVPGSALPAGAAILTQLPSGSLFRIEGQPTVWYVEAGVSRGVPSLEVFDNRFSWGDVRVISNASHLDLYQQGAAVAFLDGAVVKGSSPTVYIIADGRKLPVSSAEAFIGLGYSWGEIVTVSDSVLALHETGATISSTAQHPNGSLVKLASNPTVYYLREGKKLGIPAASAFEARRFRWSAIRTVTPDELAVYPDGGVLLWPDYTLVKAQAPEVYFVEGGKRRHIATADAFNAKNFRWDKIVSISEELMNYLPVGVSIQ